MDDEDFRPPSRERFREERRAIKRADRRRKMIGIPVVVIGLALVGTGAYIFAEGDSGESPVDVQGTSVTQTTTSTTSTTTSTTTTTLPPTTLPPTTVAPTTTAKPKPKPKPTMAPTTAAPVETTVPPSTPPPAT